MNYKTLTNGQVYNLGSKQALVDLCTKFELPTDGNKEVIAKRLFDYFQSDAYKEPTDGQVSESAQPSPAPVIVEEAAASQPAAAPSIEEATAALRAMAASDEPAPSDADLYGGTVLASQSLTPSPFNADDEVEPGTNTQKNIDKFLSKNPDVGILPEAEWYPPYAPDAGKVEGSVLLVPKSGQALMLGNEFIPAEGRWATPDSAIWPYLGAYLEESKAPPLTPVAIIYKLGPNVVTQVDLQYPTPGFVVLEMFNTMSDGSEQPLVVQQSMIGLPGGAIMSADVTGENNLLKLNYINGPGNNQLVQVQVVDGDLRGDLGVQLVDKTPARRVAIEFSRGETHNLKLVQFSNNEPPVTLDLRYRLSDGTYQPMSGMQESWVTQTQKFPGAPTWTGPSLVVGDSSIVLSIPDPIPDDFDGLTTIEVRDPDGLVALLNVEAEDYINYQRMVEMDGITLVSTPNSVKVGDSVEFKVRVKTKSGSDYIGPMPENAVTGADHELVSSPPPGDVYQTLTFKAAGVVTITMPEGEKSRVVYNVTEA